MSRNPNGLLRFPVHTRFTRSWLDEHFPADHDLPPAVALLHCWSAPIHDCPQVKRRFV